MIEPKPTARAKSHSCHLCGRTRKNWPIWGTHIMTTCSAPPVNGPSHWWLTLQANVLMGRLHNSLPQKPDSCPHTLPLCVTSACSG